MGFTCQAKKTILWEAWQVYPWTLLGLDSSRFFVQFFVSLLSPHLLCIHAFWTIFCVVVFDCVVLFSMCISYNDYPTIATYTGGGSNLQNMVVCACVA